MLGCIEISAEYVRLWNLLSRCKACRKFRKLAVRGVDVKVVVRNGKIVLRKRRIGAAMPCIENCDRMTAEEKAMFDILRFEELQEIYEPAEVDYTEDNARKQRLWVESEQIWVKSTKERNNCF